MSSIDQRDGIQILTDALVKHRVLKGIALLEEKHGPDWVNEIDLDTLDLGSASHCVLGQLYNATEVPEDAKIAWALSARGRSMYGWSVDDDEERIEQAHSCLGPEQVGFEKGIAMIDGVLIEHPDSVRRHGFDHELIESDMLDDATDDQLADLGLTRELVDNAHEAVRDNSGGYFSVWVDYDQLTEEWQTSIQAQR